MVNETEVILVISSHGGICSLSGIRGHGGERKRVSEDELGAKGADFFKGNLGKGVWAHWSPYLTVKKKPAT